MSAMIVQTPTFLTLLGGGSTHFSHVNQALSVAPILVAADGGANAAIAMGHLPDAVIGDLDSILDKTRADIPEDRIHRIAEQDSTDFEKCLRHIDAPLILALGFTGARLDHTLAACTVLARFPDKCVILMGEEDLCFLAPEQFEIDLPEGTVFSIYPLAPVRGRSQGLHYPIDGLDLSPVARVGTSNMVTGPVSLNLPGRSSLILLPNTTLEAVIQALIGL